MAILSEEQYNELKNRLTNAKLLNDNYLNILNTNKLNNTVLFLDPPYVNRPMSYNRGFEQSSFLDKLITYTGNNSLILYTDYENVNSDKLLNYGFNKNILRKMKNIAPSSDKR